MGVTALSERSGNIAMLTNHRLEELKTSGDIKDYKYINHDGLSEALTIILPSGKHICIRSDAPYEPSRRQRKAPATHLMVD